MRYFLYFMVVMLLVSSCGEDEPRSQRIVPVELQIVPHNSNNEFYAGVPVAFGVNVLENAPPTLNVEELDLQINGNKLESEDLPYTFTEPGAYKITAFVKTSHNRAYEFDTIVNIVKGPPVIGEPGRGEAVLFAWKAGANYNVLTGSYHGSSVLDYEVRSVDESLVQQGQIKTMDFGWYPEMYDHAVSASGKLALLYDNSLKIYGASLDLEHQVYFNYGNLPRKIFINDNTAVLLFDSLAHIILRMVDMNTGQMVKGSTQFVGVHDMTIYNHFFRDESRTMTYYIGPGNDRTLLMGVDVGTSVEFNQYFQPPVFIYGVTPINSGGYIISSFIPEENKLNVLGADESNVIKWNQTFTRGYGNYWYPTQGDPLTIKELDGFIYVFFDNMRCVKLSVDGRLIWDKYFYSNLAYFEDVVITSNGEFIMFGTFLPDSNGSIDTALQSDVICIRINTDGFRVGV